MTVLRFFGAGSGGGITGVDVEDEGAPVGSFTTFNFTGAGVAASDAGGGVTDIAIPGAGGAVGPGTLNRLSMFDVTGANVVDTNLEQDGAGNVQFVSDQNFLPNAANTCEVGTDALPFRRIRAQEVVSGDHVFDNPEIGVTIRVIEDVRHLLVLVDENTGKRFRLQMVEINKEGEDV